MTNIDPEADRAWLNRRRDRIVAEIRRNRRGEYKIPTWVLALTLVAIVATYLVLLITS